MSYRLTFFGGVSLPTGQPRTPVGTGPSAGAPLALPGGGVFDPHGSEQAPLALPYPLTLRASETATSAAGLESQLGVLRQFRGRRSQLFRLMSSGASQWCYARLMEMPAEREAGHLLLQPCDLHFMVESPWYDAQIGTLSNTTWTPPGGAAWWWINFSSGVAFVVDNSARAQATSFNIQVSVGALDAPLTELKVENTTLGTTLLFDGTVAAGKTLVIDTGANSALNDGVGAYADVTRPNNDAFWFRLKAGVSNTLKVTLTGGGANTVCTIQYYPTYE